jgi:hypothetical protein
MLVEFRTIVLNSIVCKAMHPTDSSKTIKSFYSYLVPGFFFTGLIMIENILLYSFTRNPTVNFDEIGTGVGGVKIGESTRF